MPWHGLQKRVMGRFSKKRQQSPPSSTGEAPCAAASATAASEPTEKGLGRLHQAAARGDLAWLRRWRWYVKAVGIDRRDQQRRTPLHLASANGHADVIRYLVKKNSQLNLADNLKRTALMKAVECQQEECVAILLEHGADPNLADAFGNTALHLAVLSANTAIAGLLLEHNVTTDAQNQEGFTPVNLAASRHHGEMLKCLLGKAVEKEVQAKNERIVVATAIHEAYLKEDNLHLQEESERLEAELREEEEKCLQSERCVRDLETALAEKKREAETCAQKVQDSLVTYLDSNTAAEQLREQLHRLEIENTRLEGTVHLNNERIEVLQRDLLASVSVGELSQQLHMESKKCMQLEAQNRDVQEKLSTLHGKYEELEKSTWQLKEEVAKLHFHMESIMVDCKQKEQCKREVEEKANQERRQHQQEVNLFIQAQAASQDTLEQNRASCWDSLRNQTEEGSRDLESQLDRMKNTQQDSTFPKESIQAEGEKYKELYLEEVNIRKYLAKNLERMEKLLTIERRKLRLNEEKESQQEEMKNRYSEKVNEVDRLQTEVSEISQQLDMESKKCMQLEAQNRDLQEELSSLHGNCEELEKSKRQLKEEVAKLQHRLETNMVDRSHTEEYKREVEERAAQERRQQLQKDSLFLQAQVASQDRSEQIRTSHHASLRNELQDRIRDLECELDRLKNTQRDSSFSKESMEAEVEKYKGLYLEEVRTRKCLAKNLERANVRLAAVNTKLLRERHRRKSSVPSSIVSGHVAASPVLHSTGLGHLGSSLGLDRSPSLGHRFVGGVENILSTNRRIEARVAKVRQELDEKITRDLQRATVGRKSGSAGSSKKC